MNLNNITAYRLIPLDRGVRGGREPRTKPLPPFLASSEGFIKPQYNHKTNQDSAGYFMGKIHGVKVSAALVCDGLGSSADSGEASAKSIEFFAEALFALSHISISTFNNQTMLSLIEQTQKRLSSEQIPGATTFTCAILFPDRAIFAKAGDSKIITGNTNGSSYHLGYDHNGYWGARETSGLRINVWRTTTEAEKDMEEFNREYSSKISPKQKEEPAEAKHLRSIYSALSKSRSSQIYATISTIPFEQDKGKNGRFILFSDGVTLPLDLLGLMLTNKRNSLTAIAKELTREELGDDRSFVIGILPKGNAFNFNRADTEEYKIDPFFTR